MARSQSTRKGKKKRPKTGGKKKKGVTKKHSKASVAKVSAAALSRDVVAMETEEAAKQCTAVGVKVKPAVKIGKAKGKVKGVRKGRPAVAGTAAMQE